MTARYDGIADPFDLIAVKQRIDPEVVDQVAMAVLLCQDAAKRGAAPVSMASTVPGTSSSTAIWRGWRREVPGAGEGRIQRGAGDGAGAVARIRAAAYCCPVGAEGLLGAAA